MCRKSLKSGIYYKLILLTTIEICIHYLRLERYQKEQVEIVPEYFIFIGCLCITMPI